MRQAERNDFRVVLALRRGKRCRRRRTDPRRDLVTAAGPGLAVELRSGRAVEDLARGGADIAIRTNRRLPADLGLGLQESTAYLERPGRPASADDLRRHPLIL